VHTGCPCKIAVVRNCNQNVQAKPSVPAMCERAARTHYSISSQAQFSHFQPSLWIEKRVSCDLEASYECVARRDNLNKARAAALTCRAGTESSSNVCLSSAKLRYPESVGRRLLRSNSPACSNPRLSATGGDPSKSERLLRNRAYWN
jgi:hypothetical protein